MLRKFVLTAVLLLITKSAYAVPTWSLDAVGDPGSFLLVGPLHRTQADGSIAVNASDLDGNGLVDFLDFFSLGNGLGEFFILDFGTNMIPGDLLPGTYLDAERAAFASPGHPGLDFAIDGSGCNMVTGSFTINDIQFAPDNTLTKFDGSFVDHCEGFDPAVTGTFVYSLTSAVPEPGSIILLISGISILVGSLVWRSRRA